MNQQESNNIITLATIHLAADAPHVENIVSSSNEESKLGHVPAGAISCHAAAALAFDTDLFAGNLAFDFLDLELLFDLLASAADPPTPADAPSSNVALSESVFSESVSLVLDMASTSVVT